MLGRIVAYIAPVANYKHALGLIEGTEREIKLSDH